MPMPPPSYHGGPGPAPATPSIASTMAPTNTMPPWQVPPGIPNSPIMPMPPPQPAPAPSTAMDPTLKNLLSTLKKHTDTLPQDVQQILSEATVTTDKLEAKALHGAVNKLSNAKKQLTMLRTSRWQMHAAWSSFLQQSTANWQGYVRDFTEQETNLQRQIADAKEQLAAARQHLHQSNIRGGDAELVEELSGEDDNLRDEVGKEIVEGLTAMDTSLKQLHARAAQMVSEDERPGKCARVSPKEEAEVKDSAGGGSCASAPALGKSAPVAPPSMLPFP